MALILTNFRGIGVVKWRGEVEETEEGSVLYVGIRCHSSALSSTALLCLFEMSG